MDVAISILRTEENVTNTENEQGREKVFYQFLLRKKLYLQREVLLVAVPKRSSIGILNLQSFAREIVISVVSYNVIKM